jgi:hypothetical protein
VRANKLRRKSKLNESGLAGGQRKKLRVVGLADNPFTNNPDVIKKVFRSSRREEALTSPAAASRARTTECSRPTLSYSLFSSRSEREGEGQGGLEQPCDPDSVFSPYE